MVNDVVAWWNNRTVPEPAPHDVLKWLSTNQHNQIAYWCDPLCGSPFTNNGFNPFLCLMKQATEGEWTRGIPPTLPLLLVSSEDDPVGQFGHGVRRVAQQLAHAGFTQVQAVLYPSLWYKILQEASKQQVYHDVTTWLSARVVSAAPVPEQVVPQPGPST